MNRKQGFEVFNLFFNLPDELCCPGINYLIPTSNGKVLNLLKMSTGEDESKESFEELKGIIKTEHGKKLLAHIMASNGNFQRIFSLLTMIWKLRISHDRRNPFRVDDKSSTSNNSILQDLDGQLKDENITELINFIFDSYRSEFDPGLLSEGCTGTNLMGFYEEIYDFLKDESETIYSKIATLLKTTETGNIIYQAYMKEKEMALEALTSGYEFDGKTPWQEEIDISTEKLIQSLEQQIRTTLKDFQKSPVTEKQTTEFWEQVALSEPLLMKKNECHTGTYVNLCRGTRAFKNLLKSRMKVELAKTGGSSHSEEGLFPSAKTLHGKVWKTEQDQYSETAFKDT